MAKNSFGYVVIRWKVDEPETESGYSRATFTVLDAGENGSEVEVGSLKYFGEKVPKGLIENIGKAVIEAHYFQRHKILAVD